MSNHHKTKISGLVALTAGMLALASLSGGCSGNRHGEVYTKDEGTRDNKNIMDMQAAKGAAADAMLYDEHFAGDRLSSLGEQKLNLIVKGSVAGRTVQVYLDVPPETAEARRLAVVAYLKDAGLASDHFVVTDGPNPDGDHLASLAAPKAYRTGDTSVTNADDTAGSAPATGGK